MTRQVGKIYQSVLLVVILGLIIYAISSGLDDYLLNNFKLIGKLLYQHLILVGISMVIASCLGLIIGIILTRNRFKKYQGIIMYIVGLGQTIPSLAILALAMSWLGIGKRPAIFALTIYTILPIARNTLAGLNSVSQELLDAARGMGLSPARVLIEVELPNALQVIMTGIRLALVINIGTAALGALVGAGGLGEQIFTGISFLDPKIMLSGAIPTTLLALIGDYSLQLLEELLISEGLKV